MSSLFVAFLVTTALVSAEPEALESLLVQQCGAIVTGRMVAPSTTKVVASEILPTMATLAAYQANASDGQPPISETGHTVSLTFDSSNAMGALVRGQAYCDYSEPPHFESIILTPRLVVLNGKPLPKADVMEAAVSTSLEMGEALQAYVASTGRHPD